MRAAYTMAYLSGPSNDWVGLEYLFNFFKSNYFYTDPLQVSIFLIFCQKSNKDVRVLPVFRIDTPIALYLIKLLFIL